MRPAGSPQRSSGSALSAAPLPLGPFGIRRMPGWIVQLPFLGMRDPRRYHVWRRSIALSAAVARAIPIRLARKSPGIRAQAIRASCQIPEAIAEGCGKKSDRDFARFCDNAVGSTTELQTQIVLCFEHEILTRKVAARLYREAGEIRQMLYGLIRRLLESDEDSSAA